MLLQTSRQTGRIPLVLVLGEEGVGKTFFLNTLLQNPTMVGSVVVGPTPKEGEALIEGRHIVLPWFSASAQENCLCCGMHSGLGDVLRKLFFEALSERTQPLNRVFIESRGVESQQLAFTLRHTPFLGQRYFHQFTFRVVSVDALLAEGPKILRGLEPKSGKDQQIVIVSQHPDLSQKVSSYPSAQSFSSEVCSSLSEEILRDLPYRKVLFLDPESLAFGLELHSG